MKNSRKADGVACKPTGCAIYEIGVAGEIVSDWRDYLEATAVNRVVDANQHAITILTCEILDQAQLIGILNMLYAWGSVLIRLERIKAG